SSHHRALHSFPTRRSSDLGKMQIGENDILIVVDVQNDFLPGGSLAVPKGDEVIAPINALAKKFAHVIMTQDWHTLSHASFASTRSEEHTSELQSQSNLVCR